MTTHEPYPGEGPVPNDATSPVTNSVPANAPVGPADALGEAPAADIWQAPAPQPAPSVGQASEKPRRPRRALVTTAFVVGTLLIIALTGAVFYLWNVHSTYVAQNEALRAEATEIGSTLATERAVAETQAAKLEQVQGELDEAKATISDVANAGAHAGDDVQTLRDIYSSMVECADARQELVDHLWERDRWTTESLRANEQSIEDFCADVRQAYREFKETL